jgi:hypothetical protein
LGSQRPGRDEVEWEATIVADVPGEVITWRSLENSDVDNAGAVRFERLPAAEARSSKSTLSTTRRGRDRRNGRETVWRRTEQQLDDDLRRFKQVLEVGEVVVSDATLLGTGYIRTASRGQTGGASELESAEMLPSQTATNYRSGVDQKGGRCEQ